MNKISYSQKKLFLLFFVHFLIIHLVPRMNAFDTNKFLLNIKLFHYVHSSFQQKVSFDYFMTDAMTTKLENCRGKNWQKRCFQTSASCKIFLSYNIWSIQINFEKHLNLFSSSYSTFGNNLHNLQLKCPPPPRSNLNHML